MLYNIGTVYETMGNYETAKKPLRKAYRLLKAPAAKGLVDDAVALKVSESLRRVKRQMRLKEEIDSAKTRLAAAERQGKGGPQGHFGGWWTGRVGACAGRPRRWDLSAKG